MKDEKKKSLPDPRVLQENPDPNSTIELTAEGGAPGLPAYTRRGTMKKALDLAEGGPRDPVED